MGETDWVASDDPVAMLRLVTESPGHANINCASQRKLRLSAVAMWRGHPDIIARLGAAELPDITERIADGLATEDEVTLARNLIKLDVDGGGRPYATYIRQAAAHMAAVLAPDRESERRRQAALLRDIVGNPFRPAKLPAWPRCDARCPRRGSPAEDDHRLPRVCPACGRDWECPWLTPQVLSLARAAYEERGRECRKCLGTGKEMSPVYGDSPVSSTAVAVLRRTPVMNSNCPACGGTGRTDDGTLDPARLLVLWDALEEAGCTNANLRWHLCGIGPWYGEQWVRHKPTHVRGCWVLDLLLGKE
jgi:hypothetical protein